MRYTTIIDISEYRSLYKNTNIRLLYLHLCLKAGYTDANRDICELSIRQLAADCGLSISAVRNALQALEKSGLLKREKSILRVRKWIAGETITPRPKTARAAKQMQADAQAQADREMQEMKEKQERKKYENEQRKAAAQGKNTFMIWYEEKMKLAAAGDIDAQDCVRRNKKFYESQLEGMKKKQIN